VCSAQIEEINRVKRVADLLTSAHSFLRDRYARRAMILDILILGASVWLTAMVFVEPRIGVRLAPPGVDREIGIGLIAIGTFFLSLVQMRVDWKGKTDAHARAATVYSAIKLASTDLLSRNAPITEDEYNRFRDRYADAGGATVAIPESIFNKLKKRHLMKVAISKHLSSHPAASIVLIHLRLWWQDNCATQTKETNEDDH
jgi:hypothetical protein